jgi:RNA polymerase sigma-70 factor (ECF subfamily)
MGDVVRMPELDPQRLEHSLQRVAEREGTVVLMTFFDENSADEVPRALGVSLANGRVIRHRGIEHLRECV